jgi:hypothetical protein
VWFRRLDRTAQRSRQSTGHAAVVRLTDHISGGRRTFAGVLVSRLPPAYDFFKVISTSSINP